MKKHAAGLLLLIFWSRSRGCICYLPPLSGLSSNSLSVGSSSASRCLLNFPRARVVETVSAVLGKNVDKNFDGAVIGRTSSSLSAGPHRLGLASISSASAATPYWLVRIVFIRALSFVHFVSFLAAWRQNVSAASLLLLRNVYILCAHNNNFIILFMFLLIFLRREL